MKASVFRNVKPCSFLLDSISKEPDANEVHHDLFGGGESVCLQPYVQAGEDLGYSE
jgi:hypothetical protein